MTPRRVTEMNSLINELLVLLQVLRVLEMLWEEGPEASDGLAWAPREEGPEIPSKCHQQPEIQLLHLSPWGKHEQSCFLSSHPEAVPFFQWFCSR